MLKHDPEDLFRVRIEEQVAQKPVCEGHHPNGKNEQSCMLVFRSDNETPDKDQKPQEHNST